MSEPDNHGGGPPRRRSLSERDWALSMGISARARDPRGDEGLRSLLVHRLDGADKAVWRLALGRPTVGVYCEPCRRWQQVEGDPPATWTCPRCERTYEAEFAVYTEVDNDE